MIKCVWMINFECAGAEYSLWKDSEIVFIPPFGMNVYFEEFDKSFRVDEYLDWNESTKTLTISLCPIKYNNFDEMDMDTERLITKHNWTT